MFNIANKHIEVFLAAAQSLNFSQAAKELYSTQSTVSRIIRQMEDEIGVMLFYRDRFSLSLTPAGEYLLRELERIQDEMSHAMEHARLLDRQQTDGIRVGIYSYALLDVVYSRCLRDFEEEHPDIPITFSFSSLGDEQLKADNLDLIIIPDISFEHKERYDSMLLAKAPLLLMCSRDNPIALRGRPVPEDFQSQELLTVFNPQLLRDFQADTLRYFFADGANITQVSNSEDLFLRLKRGGCFTLLDDYCMSIDTSGFFRYELPEECTQASFHLFWLKGNRSPSLAALLEHFRARHLQL